MRLADGETHVRDTRANAAARPGVKWHLLAANVLVNEHLLDQPEFVSPVN
jgi:hypothetical protein